MGDDGNWGVLDKGTEVAVLVVEAQGIFFQSWAWPLGHKPSQ